MTAARKAAIREMASEAYDLDAGVIHGQLQRRAEDGLWAVGDTSLDSWLGRFAGQEVYLIVASLEDERPMASKLCRTCGTEYEGVECPRCREVRRRLRGP